ncbi:MAG: efflux transporter outer membrane subunit [Glaciimonas sp.]|nr:efflux transporter outer membrane subunit [Glaciimonas sp.]
MNSQNHSRKLPLSAHIFLLTALVLVAVLAGCAAGPDFKRPVPPVVTGYTSAALPGVTVASPGLHGNPQQLVSAPVPVEWWKELRSDKLTRLIDQALQASPTLAAAQATLRQAQEGYAAQAGSSLYPQVDANLSGQRQHSNSAALGQTGDARVFNLYNASVGVHYNLDLAGGNRRALEALAAQVDYQRFQLEGAGLTLAANIATTAITQAQLASQVAATQAILLAQETQLEITHQRLALGQASQDDLLALQTQVEQTRASIPPLRNKLEQTHHLLAVLAGHAPGAGPPPSFILDDFTLPTDLPLLVPSELVRQRPDIQAAEALLHAANAEYGVAVSRLYPQVALSANLGSQALTTASLFGSGSLAWGLVGQLTQPLFNPGLPAEKRAALAAFDAAAAKYQQTVLEALRNVADVLRALDNDAQTLAAQAAADASAQASLKSIQRQYALGAASYLQLLTAQQQAQQTGIPLIAAKAQRLVDSAALYQSMGGGVLNAEALVGQAPAPEPSLD